MKNIDKPFFGRKSQLASLNALFNKKTASLVVCKGRRRVGKSRLIQVFGGKAEIFWQFQGLPPRKGMIFQDQLNSFSSQLSRQCALPKLGIDSWDAAFELLENQISEKKTVILLDEISWMANGSPDFAGFIKIAWDTLFSRHQSLVIVLCGSVSSWIDTNILNNTGFVGRISLPINLEPLPLPVCNSFWQTCKNRISSYEKLQVLAVTGCIPRYLEELNLADSSEANIQRMCFRPDSYLFKDFDHIFHDIFSRRAPAYREIVNVLTKGPKSLSEIALAIEKERSGYIGECLEDLQASGFIKKYMISPIGKKGNSRKHQYRISDNYLRFYLTQIVPKAQAIQEGLYENAPLHSIVAWDSVLGLQFETLILTNVIPILTMLNINAGVVKRIGPYLQKRTSRLEACQIDLLIETRHTVYVCELKCRHRIGIEVIQETKEKIKKLPVPKGMSIRQVLIYEGQLSETLIQECYFDKIISFEELLDMDGK